MCCMKDTFDWWSVAVIWNQCCQRAEGVLVIWTYLNISNIYWIFAEDIACEWITLPPGCFSCNEMQEEFGKTRGLMRRCSEQLYNETRTLFQTYLQHKSKLFTVARAPTHTHTHTPRKKRLKSTNFLQCMKISWPLSTLPALDTT